ncbi:hypothetical protein XANCAGTX0491_002496 [Xanthoria calcicola]
MSFLYQLLYDKLHPPSDPTTPFTTRTVLVTGANCGLGFEAALKFVRLGAPSVILACRTPSKGESAKAEIEARTGCNKDVLKVLPLDMSSYASIREFVARLRSVVMGEGGGLDAALLNAGVVQFEYATSGEGWEQTLQVNVLGTTYLGLLLLPLLNDGSTSTTTSRKKNLAFVSSGNYQFADLAPQALASPNLLHYCNQKDKFAGPEAQYAISKLFLMYAANEIAATVDEDGESEKENDEKSTPGEKGELVVNSVNPGATATNLTRNISGFILSIVAYVYLNLLARTAEQGSRSLVRACALGRESQGGFWQDDRLVGRNHLVESDEGKKLQKRVWREILTALKDQDESVGRYAS